jgi:hypothetical protein
MLNYYNKIESLTNQQITFQIDLAIENHSAVSKHVKTTTPIKHVNRKDTIKVQDSVAIVEDHSRTKKASCHAQLEEKNVMRVRNWDILQNILFK